MCSNVSRARRLRTLTVLSLLVLSQYSGALPLTDFYNFNATYGDSATARKDDGGSGEVWITLPFPYFNQSYTKIYVNNNGVISFVKELSTYKPEEFPLKDNTAIISPFWADVDVENVGGSVWYRQSVDPDVLREVTSEINQYFPRGAKFRATWIFIATWDNVGFYGADKVGKNQRNTFQAVLVTDVSRSFAIFNYNKIQWTTGSNSAGSTSSGLGGEPAQVTNITTMAGFNAGDGINFYAIDGSRTDRIVNLTLTSNVGIPGKWAFQVDGNHIQDLHCVPSEFLTLAPNFGSMMGGKQITVTGACFNSSFNASLLEVANSSFHCKVIREDEARCITPTLFTTGDFTFDIDGKYTATYTSVNIAKAEIQLIRVDPYNWIPGAYVTVKWDPPADSTDQMKIQVLGYREFPNRVWFPSQQININSSLGEFSFHLANVESDVVIVRIVGVSESSGSSQYNSSQKLWSDIFSIKQDSEKWCKNWLQKNIKAHYKLPLLEPCPCNSKQAFHDTGRFQSYPECHLQSREEYLSRPNCFYRPSSNHCVISNYESASPGGQLCCYDKDGDILDLQETLGGGTTLRYHYRAQGAVSPYVAHFEEDILPYYHCCENMAAGSDVCKEYQQLRKPTSCVGYDPPSPAQAAGDPHLVTLDGKGYTFNGLGDFILAEDVNGSVVIQVRTERAKDNKGQYQNATVFTAIAMKLQNSSSIVEVHMHEEMLAEVLVDGVPRDIQNEASNLDDITISRNDSQVNVSQILVVIDTVGASITIDATADLLNVLVMIGSEKLKGNLRGLLGNYNKDPLDDFLSRDGVTVPSSSSMEQIHYQFGLTWAVLPYENLFSRNLSSSELSRQAFEPVFLDTMDQSNLRNGTEAICGDQIQCRFDFEVTGIVSIAKSTKEFVSKFDSLRRDIQPDPHCEHIDAPPNSNVTVTGVKVGDTAILVCDYGFVPQGGSAVIFCDSSGLWNDSLPDCAKPVTPDPGRISWETILIAVVSGGGVLLIVLIVVTVVACRTCRGQTKRKQGEELIELPTIYSVQDIPQPVFENPAFIESLQRLKGEEGFRIPRPTYIDPKIYVEYF